MPSPEQVGDLEFHRTPQVPGFTGKLPVLRDLASVRGTRKSLLRLAHELKPDVIHSHSPVLNALAAIPVGRKLGIPVIYEIRAFWEDAAAANGQTREGSPRFVLTRMMEDHAMRRADAVTTICEGLRGDITSRGIPDDKVTVIPNAVDVDGFRFGVPADPALQQRLGLVGCTVIGFAGGSEPDSGGG